MNPKLYRAILLIIVAILVTALDILVTSLYWQHEAAIHHAAHFESNTWGIVSYHWNDEYAQIVDANDSIIPPKLK